MWDLCLPGRVHIVPTYMCNNQQHIQKAAGRMHGRLQSNSFKTKEIVIYFNENSSFTTDL